MGTKFGLFACVAVIETVWPMAVNTIGGPTVNEAPGAPGYGKNDNGQLGLECAT